VLCNTYSEGYPLRVRGYRLCKNRLIRNPRIKARPKNGKVCHASKRPVASLGIDLETINPA
jgi:hypothetical protein